MAGSAGSRFRIRGPTLIPPHFVAIGGKAGILYLLDRERLRIDRPGSERKELQSIRAAGGVYESAAYWNKHLYLTSVIPCRTFLCAMAAFQIGSLPGRREVRKPDRFARHLGEWNPQRNRLGH
jgi:hypothetical protein